MAGPLLGLQRADALRVPLGPFGGLGRGAIALRLAGGGDQHDRHRDREQHRYDDRDPGSDAGPPPEPGRELVESGEWLVALVRHASGSMRPLDTQAQAPICDARRKLRFTMLDVRRLRLLSELSRRGTIAEVAKAVGYSASAVSQSLAQLEREAGMALLERDGRQRSPQRRRAPARDPRRHGAGRARRRRVRARGRARRGPRRGRDRRVPERGGEPRRARGARPASSATPSSPASSASTSPRTGSRCCARVSSTC